MTKSLGSSQKCYNTRTFFASAQSGSSKCHISPDFILDFSELFKSTIPKTHLIVKARTKEKLPDLKSVVNCFFWTHIINQLKTNTRNKLKNYFSSRNFLQGYVSGSKKILHSNKKGSQFSLEPFVSDYFHVLKFYTASIQNNRDPCLMQSSYILVSWCR